MAPYPIPVGKNRKERANLSTNNGYIVDKAKHDVGEWVSLWHLYNYFCLGDDECFESWGAGKTTETPGFWSQSWGSNGGTHIDR